MTNTEIVNEKLEILKAAYTVYENNDCVETFDPYWVAARLFWDEIYMFHDQGWTIVFNFRGCRVVIDSTGFLYATSISRVRWLTSAGGSYGGHEMGLAISVGVE